MAPSERGDNKAALLFLGPWFIGLLLITVGPILASLFLSFTDYNLLQPPSWTGLDNYARMLDDARLHQSLRVTFTYVFVSIPLQLALALALALFLDRGVRGLPFYRSVYYLPSLLGGSVAIALLWRQVFGTQGLVNQFLGVFGIEGQGWVSHPDTALGTLVILNVWTFGAPMVIFLAGLRQIPEMYYEAAQIDGAGKVRQFLAITLPLLTPIVFFNLVLQVINAFQSFTQAFVVSGGSGGPVDSTLFYTLYLYQKGFGALDMGYASAMAWLLLAIVAGLTAINFVVSKYWVFYDD
ncbi:sugar ABC transporter permease [Cellulomonas sp. zg-Y338]|uniref:Sugar ABC transporter permease n=1 Tax=Cellulomonas chengniuliangii TaxID=2968084 RepID=A0ABY5L260_9CELL|nr:sugar ABC transporter permease [Cellulomonas chengniuliangii]MCC2307457.1 sugar ABC transporter permease [Cellulomonas chengniuliangii]MCC2317954.1 sugar ABC transporter permease [Cellulomonas chengniuliangii]UUI76877.1 sugar ABC transporter permease [Cellulomonas chengniuliangii]